MKDLGPKSIVVAEEEIAPSSTTSASLNQPSAFKMKHIEEQNILRPDRTQPGNIEDESTPISNSGDVEDATASAVTAMLPEVRIPYDNGYGDFWFCDLDVFGDKINFLKGGNLSKEMRDQFGLTSSNGVPVLELGDFQRDGSFPYPKLPFEIRQKILRLLLEPLFTDYYRGDIFAGSFVDVSLAGIKNPWDRPCSTERTDAVTERRAELWKKKAIHPTRTDIYNTTINARKTTNEGSIDWFFLEWLRQASYVSSSFRVELASAMWARTDIITTVANEFWILEKFLKDRPAIHLGIKGMKLKEKLQDVDYHNKLTFHEFYNHIDADFQPWYFTSLCGYMAKNLKLEDLQIQIELREEDMELWEAGKKCIIDDLAVVSKLNVSKSFTITLKKLHYDYDFDPNFGNEHHDLIREMMMPETLKVQPAVTEEEKYLESRENEISGEEKE